VFVERAYLRPENLTAVTHWRRYLDDPGSYLRHLLD
jgi:hypothetical protein